MRRIAARICKDGGTEEEGLCTEKAVFSTLVRYRPFMLWFPPQATTLVIYKSDPLK